MLLRPPEPGCHEKRAQRCWATRPQVSAGPHLMALILHNLCAAPSPCVCAAPNPGSQPPLPSFPQATQLTRLHLEGFCPYDARQFFGHLARATGLRSLELDGWADVGTPSFLSSAVIPDARERQGLLASLGAALEALTALTSLTLNNLKLAACLGAPSGGLAVLPCLAELDVSLNSFDPAGSMRALPFGPYQSSLRTLVVDGTVAVAALAQPDHVLWGMPALTRLSLAALIMWQMRTRAMSSLRRDWLLRGQPCTCGCRMCPSCR